MSVARQKICLCLMDSSRDVRGQTEDLLLSDRLVQACLSPNDGFAYLFMGLFGGVCVIMVYMGGCKQIRQ